MQDNDFQFHTVIEPDNEEINVCVNYHIEYGLIVLDCIQDRHGVVYQLFDEAEKRLRVEAFEDFQCRQTPTTPALRDRDDYGEDERK